MMHDTSRKRVMPILIHGDASFAGLGATLEVFSPERVVLKELISDAGSQNFSSSPSSPLGAAIITAQRV
jgi:hypothetical protein